VCVCVCVCERERDRERETSVYVVLYVCLYIYGTLSCNYTNAVMLFKASPSTCMNICNAKVKEALSLCTVTVFQYP